MPVEVALAEADGRDGVSAFSEDHRRDMRDPEYAEVFTALMAQAGWRWYSICSRHQRWDPDCDLCQRGHWVDELSPEFIAERKLWETDPDEWRRRANERG